MDSRIYGICNSNTNGVVNLNEFYSQFKFFFKNLLTGVKYNTYYQRRDASGENVVAVYLKTVLMTVAPSLTISVTTTNLSEVKSRMTIAATTAPTGLMSEFENCDFLKNKTAPTRKGHVVAQLVEALRYKPEGRGFNSRWCHWNFSLTLSFRPHRGRGVDSTSNRNEYQEFPGGGKGGRCIGVTNLSPSCADCLEIWEPRPPGTLRACPGL